MGDGDDDDDRPSIVVGTVREKRLLFMGSCGYINKALRHFIFVWLFLAMVFSFHFAIEYHSKR